MNNHFRSFNNLRAKSGIYAIRTYNCLEGREHRGGSKIFVHNI